MPSYETLAVIVLALSATPAFSAPVVYVLRISSPRAALSDECYHRPRDNQQQARAAIEEEPASGGSGLLPGVLKSAGIGAGLSVLGDAEKHFFGNHTRRDTPSAFHFQDLIPVSNNGDWNTAPIAHSSARLEQRAPGLEERESLSAGSLGMTR